MKKMLNDVVNSIRGKVSRTTTKLSSIRFLLPENSVGIEGRLQSARRKPALILCFVFNVRDRLTN